MKRNVIDFYFNVLMFSIEDILECISIRYKVDKDDKKSLEQFEKELEHYVGLYYGFLSIKECLRDNKKGGDLAKKALDWMFVCVQDNIEETHIIAETDYALGLKEDVKFVIPWYWQYHGFYYDVLTIREKIF